MTHSKFPWTTHSHTPTAVFDGDGRRIIDQWVAPDGWRDIETAPQDETRILLFQSDRGAFEGWWQDDWPQAYHFWTDDRDSEPEPTHWMPLPAPPSDAPTPTPLDPDTAAANAVMIAGLPGLIEALKVARDLIRNAMEYGYEPDIAYDCGIAQVDAALASIGRTL